MKALRIVLLVVLAAILVPVAQADQIPTGDPVVKTGGGLPGAAPSFGAAPGSAPAAIITTSFDIVSPSGTSPGTSPCDLIQGTITTVSPNCFFQDQITVNGVGEAIGMLTFDALGVDPSTVNCGFLSGSPFTQCGVDPLGTNGTEISFYGGTIPFGSDFTLDFEGFPKNFSFGTTASVAPDPGTLSLMLAGGLALLLARRRMRAAPPPA